MKNTLSTQIMFYFNMIIFGVGLANTTYLSIIMNNDARFSWLVPLFLIIPFIILMFFIKKNYSQYNQIQKTLLFKILITIYSILCNAIIIYYTSVILSNWFYEETSIYLFIVTSSFLSIILALFSSSAILRIGFIWAICYVIIALFGITIHNESDLMLLFPLELHSSTFLNNMFFLIIPLDNLIYLFLDQKENDLPHKKTMIISGILTLILCSIQLIVNLTLVNYRFYDGLETPAIEAFFMYYSKNHIGHYDIVLIINVLVTFLYKSSLYGNFALHSFPKSKKYFIIPFLALIISVISINMIYIKNLKFYLSFFSLGFILLLYLYIILFQRRKKI